MTNQGRFRKASSRCSRKRRGRRCSSQRPGTTTCGSEVGRKWACSRISTGTGTCSSTHRTCSHRRCSDGTKLKLLSLGSSSTTQSTPKSSTTQKTVSQTSQTSCLIIRLETWLSWRTRGLTLKRRSRRTFRRRARGLERRSPRWRSWWATGTRRTWVARTGWMCRACMTWSSRCRAAPNWDRSSNTLRDTRTATKRWRKE
mmetsp:Transcript_25510/g.84014  ORF Transcript_25510/g.84014 Transcript_25510/m.84014 type:complete len:200 (-) Transcript_25510:424-1023(-)